MAKLTTSAAAKYMGIPASTLRYWRMVHYGPAFTRYSPRTVVYDQQDLDSWSEHRRYDPSTVRATQEKALASR